ncbi:acyl-CoA/acyl-ACP dehydrogenase [Angustibacter sp. Root456]|uniref:acyl-CoA/acyl-ACP dehydrogenase n=1 Tax=Angustibacter sp. Root456 TaxID=1736539 RepID=UPI0009EC315A|nr:acyl-CoA/acyl-ACP dehydrogenase [Angustibacter sp. Root456]
MLQPDADPDVARAVAVVTGPDVGHALALAADLTATAPLPGSGRTLARWDLLARLAAADLTTARVVEAHLDAVAILAEAHAAGVETPAAAPGTTWGVFAAEGPGVRLDAHETPSGWQVTGDKPWCSLAGRLTHALVTAHDGDERRLLAVDLHAPGVTVHEGTWHARGLTDVPSGPVTFDAVPAEPVGDPGWYLRRAGFAHGGIGVAAAWFGGAVGVARALWRAAERRPPDQVALMHLGDADLDLHAAATVMRAAAADVDAGRADGDAGIVLALRARSAVVRAAEAVLHRVAHGLGPAPLALDDAHARRVADLTVYLRQHHAERDSAALGRALLDAGSPPW